MPELSVILVSYNDRQNLEFCLRSLLDAAPSIGLEVLVVDNNSSDGSPEMVKKLFPACVLKENRQNVGFGKANNQGIAESSGEFILFLNSDTVVDAAALNLLLEEIRKEPNRGAIGPALLSERDTYQVSFGKKVDFFAEFFQKGFWNPYFSQKLKHDPQERDVGWLSAACLLVRKRALEEAGYFDENFFLYFEDIDLCYRIRSKGWRLVFLPQARMRHLGGASTSTVRSFSRYQYRKSQIYFYRKHNSRTSLNLLFAYLRLNFFLSFVFKKGGEREGTSRREFFRLLRE